MIMSVESKEWYGDIYLRYMIDEDASYSILAEECGVTRGRIYQIVKLVDHDLQIAFGIGSPLENRGDLGEAQLKSLAKKVAKWAQEEGCYAASV